MRPKLRGDKVNPRPTALTDTDRDIRVLSPIPLAISLVMHAMPNTPPGWPTASAAAYWESGSTPRVCVCVFVRVAAI